MRGTRSEANAGAREDRALDREVADQALVDRALVVALRSRTPSAVRAFMARYRELLVVAARKLGGSSGDAEDIADEVLGDAVMHFVASEIAVPLSVRGYLLRSLRNRLLNVARAGGRRARAGLAAVEAAGADESHYEQAVVECVSEHSLRESQGPQWDGPPPLAPALGQLAHALTAELSPEEQLLLTWLSHYVPPRDIASWLGLSYEAVAKRVGRLRARLHASAARYVDQLNSADRTTVRAFLRRSGHDLPAAPPVGRTPK